MNFSSKKNKIILLSHFFLIFAIIILSFTYFFPKTLFFLGNKVEKIFIDRGWIKKDLNNTDFGQIIDVNLSSKNFQQLQSYFKDLANNKGGEYAFLILKKAQVQPNIDMHLLGHSIGDILYKQKGLSGITFCDNDFRNACSHSIVIGILNDDGVDALPKIAEACREAPGGSGAYTMCFHGLGHGILAYYGYNFEKAVELCKKTGSKKFNDRESSECIGGMVMEIVGGGFHDRDLWTKERLKTLKKEQPLALCNSSLIPENAKYFCYVYITPFLFETVGADMGRPSENDFAKAFPLCEKVVGPNIQSKLTCYGGFGKEFIVLVKDRDIRLASMREYSDEQLKKIYYLCTLAKKDYGIEACTLNALGSLYWGGENDPNVSIRYCSFLSNDKIQEKCFESLYSSANYYSQDSEGFKSNFCGLVPEKYKQRCQTSLRTK